MKPCTLCSFNQLINIKQQSNFYLRVLRTEELKQKYWDFCQKSVSFEIYREYYVN